MFAVPVRTMLIAGFSLAILACGRTQPKHAARHGVAVGAVTVLTSARVDASVVQHTLTPAHRSCAGERYCREDVVDSADTEAISDLDDQCTRRGGTPSSTRCVREGAVASCSINGSDALDGIKVFAYADDAATTVAEHCDALDGTFERLPGAVAN